MDRLARRWPTRPVWQASAVVGFGGLVALLEFVPTGLDHGTHLLVILATVVATAVLLGPRPAAMGLMVGAALALAASVLTADGVHHGPGTYVQLATYLLVGGASLALLSLAVDRRGRRAAVQLRVPVVVASWPDLTEGLTAREAEVLHLAASGISVEEIAGRLYVSPNTVKTHLTHVYAKLHVRGRTDAVRAAMHLGILTPADICPHHFPADPPESPIPVTRNHSIG